MSKVVDKLRFSATWAFAAITLSALLFVIFHILSNGIQHLTPSLFEWQSNSDNVSMMPAIINTLFMVILTLLFAVPIGVFTSIYLVEYTKRGSRVVKLVRSATEMLAGIPSIVYGLFGFIFFLGVLGTGYSLIAGSLTLTIMILPLVIRTTEEALKSVPDGYREGAFALGSGKLRSVFKVVLPSAMPGILAGVILATGRIVGETAALIFTAGTVARVASSFFDSTRTLSVHMWVLSGEGHNIPEAYATAVVLLLIVLTLNLVSAFIAKRIQKG
ncbi:MAG: phosphate ABC transporter permease PstA [Defluviitaleaceae bacterium]|nr:phosphate ABC transporter permease PstA [Defluviitaleaceae bacterium]